MSTTGWPDSPPTRSGTAISDVLGGISRRLSKPQGLIEATRELPDLYQPLSDDFVQFYPLLQAFAQAALADVDGVARDA